MSVALDITERLKPPRAVFLPFKMGHHFGVPFHAQLQREIVTAALSRLENAKYSGDVFVFPKTWAEIRKERKDIERSLEIGVRDYD